MNHCLIIYLFWKNGGEAEQLETGIYSEKTKIVHPPNGDYSIFGFVLIGKLNLTL